MVRLAAATVSTHAAAAAERIATEGGNAVDAAIAASLIGMVAEPGVVSLGGGGFFTIWAPDSDPVVIDGYAAMPGLGRPPERFGGGVFDAWMAYGGGMTTTVGHGSVAVPGAIAACETASSRFGALPWAAVVEPAIELADAGFPLSEASHRYLTHCHETIFGWHPPSRAAIHDADGNLLPVGARIEIPYLADTLRSVAGEGAGGFYSGPIAERIVADMDSGGGLLTLDDLREYRVEIREPLRKTIRNWEVSTNPPPAVGGSTLAALLMLMGAEPDTGWNEGAYTMFVNAQRAVFRFRREELDGSGDIYAAAARLLTLAGEGEWDAARHSPSTIHTSVVDGMGVACAATFSAGYGAGVMPPGTGIWMNNSLGEIELNPGGFRGTRPGTRLLSNMAPTVARSADGTVVAIGSPGADRITTAILQSFLNFANLGMPLQEAVTHPRLHVELEDDGTRVAYEPGVRLPDGLGGATRRFDHPDMFFGGVAAAARHPSGELDAGVDPRRSGKAVITG